MSNSMIHTPTLSAVLTYAGQRWHPVYRTDRHLFTYNGSMMVLAWARLADGRYELDGLRYSSHEGDMWANAREEAMVWDKLNRTDMVTVSYIVSGKLEHVPVSAHEALDWCKELITVHGTHIKHVAVYVGTERLWAYNNRTSGKAAHK